MIAATAEKARKVVSFRTSGFSAKDMARYVSKMRTAVSRTSVESADKT